MHMAGQGEGTRQRLVEHLWRGQDPLRGFPANLFEPDLQGWNSEHQYLAESIQQLCPAVIVEVGVWKGSSTIFMAQTAKSLGLSTVVIAIDTWLGSHEHWLHEPYFAEMSFFHGYPALYYKFLSNVVRADVADHVLPIPIDSVNAAEILRAFGVSPTMIHLDGAHHYDSVLTDLRLWWPAIAPGGVLIGDDYHGDGYTWPLVQQAFDDFFTPLGLTPIEHTIGKCRIVKPLVP